MTIKLSVTVRNASLDSFETAIGASPRLKIWTGSPPANLGDAATGTLLVDATLPSDWLAAASNGTKALSGTWQDLSADGAGTAGYFRILASDNTTVHAQGTVTLTAGGGDMTLDNTNIAVGQQVSITSFNLTAGNA